MEGRKDIRVCEIEADGEKKEDIGVKQTRMEGIRVCEIEEDRGKKECVRKL